MLHRVRTLALAAGLLSLALDAGAVKAPAPKPAKVTVAEAQGAVFQRKSAVHENGADGPATDVSLLKSRDGHFEAGVYSAGASDQPIESYEDDEFMYFLEGGVTLTSTDGTVLEVQAGEGVVVPKGWKGRWTTKGYKKYYAIYQSGPKAK